MYCLPLYQIVDFVKFYNSGAPDELCMAFKKSFIPILLAQKV